MLLTTVDRDWQNQGLHRYSTSALFGALQRFGIPGGEQAFRVWAASHFPAEMVSRLWRKYWSGGAVFAGYPLLAAEELWNRLIGPSPAALASAVELLLYSLLKVVTTQAGAAPEEMFARVDELRARAGQLPEALSTRFPSTVHEELKRRLREVDDMVEYFIDDLMKCGRADLCERLLELQGYFDPRRALLSRSRMLRSAGDTATATHHLELAGSPSTCLHQAETIVHGLITSGALAEARTCLEDFIREADLSGDGRLAGRLRQQLFRVLLLLGNPEAVGFPSSDAVAEQTPHEGAVWKSLRERRLSSSALLHFCKVTQPPVEIEALAYRMDVRVILETGANVSGRLEVSADRETATVWLSAQEHATRRNFTLAFLLGHLLYSPLERSHRRNHATSSRDPDDGRALDFASALLIPFWMLGPRVLNEGNPPSLRELARTFQVSEAAMRAAYDKLQAQIQSL